ncbi:Na+/H+ antiporter NhaA [Pedobacter glucosidilyticus]|uniref:Na+/H+ antiporter NhaA n=1 Tax=Pedobacter glucosidilyticus TaxID=1122941 RepID=UPI00041AA5BD|nr:Na+/H+ antiporter NhaA [Pedobacter glucosidilyticus]
MRKLSQNIYKKFIEAESKGGIILILCMVLSILVANTLLGDYLINLLNFEFGFEGFGLDLKYSTLSWINDGLMAVFFLYVGLEIKREIVDGELKSVKQAFLPIIAALGGMLMPATLYFLFNYGAKTEGGWGIPMATDIAFAIGILAVLGNRVPNSLKIFLTALAIVDDLGAIVVIALFYTSDIHFNYLLLALGVFAFQMSLNYFGVRKVVFYIIPGLALWYFIHHSGIHATIAGVLTAIAIPATSEKRKYSPMEKLEHALSKPVGYVIIPLFAFVNTNIRFESAMLDGVFSPLGLGIIAGLFIGKPLGITLASWIAVKLKVAKKPRLASWKQVIGVGMLGGIGFTMSIFVSLLSFSSPLFQLEAKFCILIASLISAGAGYVYLNILSKKSAKNEKVEVLQVSETQLITDNLKVA